MGKQFRAVLIGCGAIGCRNDTARLRSGIGLPLSHAGAYRLHPEIELVAAADPDRDRLREFGEAWGVVALYPDYRELLMKEAVDLLSVCTPTPLHVEIVGEACGRGAKAVFCEKPLAATPGEALAVIRACKASGTILAVNYVRRWNPTLGALAARLAAGEFGEIRRATAYYTKGIANNGTHVVDLLGWFVGPIRSVRALRATQEDGGDLAADALCLTETGVPCYLQAYRQEDFNILELDLLTSCGRLRVAANGRRIEWYRAGPDPAYAQYRVLAADPEVTPTEWERCLSLAVEDLVTCLKAGGRPACEGAEACEALRVTSAILASHEEGGRTVELSEVEGAEPAPAEAKGGRR